MEELSIYFYGAGAALLLAGLIWLLIIAFRQGVFWGLTIWFPPVALAFLVRHFRKAFLPGLLFLLGILVVSIPPTYSRLAPVDLGPLERIVDGDRSVTLTNWDRTDYGILLAKTDTVILQMANGDVTDATILPLASYPRLRELDLNNTQITDASLELLAKLPALKSLKLKGTKITDEGFQRTLAPIDRLEAIDLRDTGVTKETADTWKKAKPNRRVLR